MPGSYRTNPSFAGSQKPPQFSLKPLIPAQNPVLPMKPVLASKTPETKEADDPMDLSRASQFRGPLSEAEKKHRRENNLCNYFADSGHFANTCPKKCPRPSVLSSATLEKDVSALVLYEAKT